MSDYNKFPENAILIDPNAYVLTRDFFNCHIESQESRQCFYESNNPMKGVFSLRIFWVKKSLGLGYGMADDWVNKKISFFRFGSDDNWSVFKREVASQFVGDNS